jgi:hypothetical protein
MPAQGDTMKDFETIPVEQLSQTTGGWDYAPQTTWGQKGAEWGNWLGNKVAGQGGAWLGRNGGGIGGDWLHNKVQPTPPGTIKN